MGCHIQEEEVGDSALTCDMRATHTELNVMRAGAHTMTSWWVMSNIQKLVAAGIIPYAILDL
jgi:hypothetical protein